MSHSDDANSRLAAAVTDSRVVAALDRVGDRLAGLGQGYRAERLGTWGSRTVTESSLYRWLTADPDPEVIVIDLRKSHTFGPFVTVLDCVLAWIDAAATSSSAVALARILLMEFRAAPVRFVGAAVALGSASTLLVSVALGALGVLPMVVLVALAVTGLVGMQVTASWADLVDSQVGRLVIAALEPPADDPPVDADDRNE